MRAARPLHLVRSMETIDAGLLASCTGGDAASSYAKNVSGAWHDTTTRAHDTLSAARQGQWNTAARQGAATVVDGMHAAGQALSPVGDVVSGLFGAGASKVIK
jgi:hypothetical protein